MDHVNCPRISVVIPSKNRPECLQLLLEDLRKQTWPPQQIIVVDQSDEPYSLAGVTHLVDHQRGPCAARNLGTSVAEGDIIVFLDDDVRLEEDILFRLCEPIAGGRFKAATGAIQHAGSSISERTSGAWLPAGRPWIRVLTSGPQRRNDGVTLSFGGCGSAVLKTTLEEVGGFDPFFDPDGAGEDREMALRLFHRGHAIAYCGSATIHHLGWRAGGRRAQAAGLLPPMDRALLYIVRKYFGPEVFEDFVWSLYIDLLRRTVTLAPRSWIRAIRRIRSAREVVREVVIASPAAI
jgi:glycosyltransferase involved in cell wall biosynthesis